jgi:hypothetical protein
MGKSDFLAEFQIFFRPLPGRIEDLHLPIALFNQICAQLLVFDQALDLIGCRLSIHGLEIQRRLPTDAAREAQVSGDDGLAHDHGLGVGSRKTLRQGGQEERIAFGVEGGAGLGRHRAYVIYAREGLPLGDMPLEVVLAEGEYERHLTKTPLLQRLPDDRDEFQVFMGIPGRDGQQAELAGLPRGQLGRQGLPAGIVVAVGVGDGIDLFRAQCAAHPLVDVIRLHHISRRIAPEKVVVQLLFELHPQALERWPAPHIGRFGVNVEGQIEPDDLRSFRMEVAGAGSSDDHVGFYALLCGAQAAGDAPGLRQGDDAKIEMGEVEVARKVGFAQRFAHARSYPHMILIRREMSTLVYKGKGDLHSAAEALVGGVDEDFQIRKAIDYRTIIATIVRFLLLTF